MSRRTRYLHDRRTLRAPSRLLMRLLATNGYLDGTPIQAQADSLIERLVNKALSKDDDDDMPPLRGFAPAQSVSSLDTYPAPAPAA